MEVRAVAIAKFVGMGSILQATPLIRSVKDTYPKARIIFVTGRSCRGLLERLVHVDSILTVDDRNLVLIGLSTLRTIGSLLRARPDLYIDLEVYSAYASIMALLSGARNRAGFYRESAWHKIGIYDHLVYFSTRNPIRHVYMQLGRAVGCLPVESRHIGPILVKPADRQELEVKLDARCTSAGYVVVNANASDLMIERRWPGERFAALIDQLLDSHGLYVVLIGSSAERAYVEGVYGRITSRERVINLAGELSLGALFALLENARCVVTNDTGPMHMAWALGAPTVCLFGPVDPNQYGWAGQGVELIYKRIYCSPCVHEVDEPPCQGHNVCMQRIEVEEVAMAVDRVLNEPPHDRVVSPTPDFFTDFAGAPLGLVLRGSVRQQGPHTIEALAANRSGRRTRRDPSDDRRGPFVHASNKSTSEIP
jgi:lipopolysaccharide heptosyltransferase II